ncbi:MAG: enoyl-CoA hydratase/isomerase family protein, partial [Betaproteobacteria bacterium]|nr:enoyl-CoA hydratase/isomerase family protein [Betaproteobacteria bacterium]
EKSFAAGADIKEMAEAGTIEMLQRGIHKLWRTIAACPRPVIAAVNGFALGGGCELAMTCDIIIAGESARFGQPEVRIGIIPGGGGTQRLTRAVGKYKAMKYILTGEMFSAKEAFDMGLVSEVVPDGEVEKRAIEIARQIAELPPLAVQLAKEAVLAGMDAPLTSALAFEAKSLQILFSSQDQKEGMRAFIEKRKPKFSGR